MKKRLFLIFNIFFAIFFVCIFCFAGCATKNSSRISLIVSNTYGSIKPIDVYEIKGGSILFTERNKDIELVKKYSYCAINSSETKKEFISSAKYIFGLKVDSKYKIGVWDIKNARPAIGYPVKEEYRQLYSEYYGEKEFVSAKTDVSFYKTLPIELEEKSDTYKITFYKDDNNSFSDPICFNNYEKTISGYKKVVEVLKTDISKIEYFS